jgi:hypothetical protein
MAIWISVAALLVSIAGYVNTLWISIRNVRIQRAQTRTDLLLKVVDLRLEYANFNRRIRSLEGTRQSPIPKDVAILLAGASQFREFERRTELYYEVLSDPNHKLNFEEQEVHRGNFETLLKQLAADNRRLDELLEADRSVEHVSPQDTFGELKRRVLHTVITNNLPVELHALRKFLIDKGYTHIPRFQQFLEKWLSSVAVIIGLPALNVFTAPQISQMKEELSGLEV